MSEQQLDACLGCDLSHPPPPPPQPHRLPPTSTPLIASASHNNLPQTHSKDLEHTREGSASVSLICNGPTRTQRDMSLSGDQVQPSPRDSNNNNDNNNNKEYDNNNNNDDDGGDESHGNFYVGVEFLQALFKFCQLPLYPTKPDKPGNGTTKGQSKSFSCPTRQMSSPKTKANIGNTKYPAAKPVKARSSHLHGQNHYQDNNNNNNNNPFQSDHRHHGPHPGHQHLSKPKGKTDVGIEEHQTGPVSLPKQEKTETLPQTFSQTQPEPKNQPQQAGTKADFTTALSQHNNRPISEPVNLKKQKAHHHKRPMPEQGTRTNPQTHHTKHHRHTDTTNTLTSRCVHSKPQHTSPFTACQDNNTEKHTLKDIIVQNPQHTKPSSALQNNRGKHMMRQRDNTGDTVLQDAAVGGRGNHPSPQGVPTHSDTPKIPPSQDNWPAQANGLVMTDPRNSSNTAPPQTQFHISPPGLSSTERPQTESYYRPAGMYGTPTAWYQPGTKNVPSTLRRGPVVMGDLSQVGTESESSTFSTAHTQPSSKPAAVLGTTPDEQVRTTHTVPNQPHSHHSRAVTLDVFQAKPEPATHIVTMAQSQSTLAMMCGGVMLPSEHYIGTDNLSNPLFQSSLRVICPQPLVSQATHVQTNAKTLTSEQNGLSVSVSSKVTQRIIPLQPAPLQEGTSDSQVQDTTQNLSEIHSKTYKHKHNPQYVDAQTICSPSPDLKTEEMLTQVVSVNQKSQNASYATPTPATPTSALANTLGLHTATKATAEATDDHLDISTTGSPARSQTSLLNTTEIADVFTATASGKIKYSGIQSKSCKDLSKTLSDLKSSQRTKLKSDNVISSCSVTIAENDSPGLRSLDASLSQVKTDSETFSNTETVIRREKGKKSATLPETRTKRMDTTPHDNLDISHNFCSGDLKLDIPDVKAETIPLEISNMTETSGLDDSNPVAQSMRGETTPLKNLTVSGNHSLAGLKQGKNANGAEIHYLTTTATENSCLDDFKPESQSTSKPEDSPSKTKDIVENQDTLHSFKPVTRGQGLKSKKSVSGISTPENPLTRIETSPLKTRNVTDKSDLSASYLKPVTRGRSRAGEIPAVAPSAVQGPPRSAHGGRRRKRSSSHNKKARNSNRAASGNSAASSSSARCSHLIKRQ